MEAAAAENLRAKAAEEQEDPSDTAEFPLAGGGDSVPSQDEDGEDYEEGYHDEDPSAAPTSRIDFGSLQFGRDYEIT